MREVKDIMVNGVSLEFILEEHKKWLYGDGGKCANLSYADLSSANLSYADLSSANLSYADLSYADLSSANLRYADLSSADLSSANLSYANLRYANLSSANLRSANLRSADLRSANLRSADLRYANLSSADLRYAKELDTCLYNELTAFFLLSCPEEGSFIAWKKCDKNTIVKLEIPSEAKRSSATSRKCRSEFAKVLQIQNIDGTLYEHDFVKSQRGNLIYKIGEFVYPDSFDENRWDECSNGIHFFITREEAVRY